MVSLAVVDRVVCVVLALVSTCLGEVWDVRLLNDGGHIYEGRVEVDLGSRGWFGTCDRNWGMEEAIVVCNQLRYPGAMFAVQNYERVTTVLLSRDWQCTGNEPQLMQCSNYLPTLLCFESAGVICHRPGYLGCYSDDFDVLSSTQGNMHIAADMTHESCKHYCMSHHFRIIGIRNGNECYCGLAEVALQGEMRLSDAECQLPCGGDYRQVCGGLSAYSVPRLSVFDVNMEDCTNPGEPHHGRQLDNDYRFGAIVRFQCEVGYELIGVTAIQCILAPGGPGEGVIWSTSIPSCALVRTTEAPRPTDEPTTTVKTTTRMTTTERTTTATEPTTTRPVITTTERVTTQRTTTTETMPVTEEKTTTTMPMEQTSETMSSTAEPSSSSPPPSSSPSSTESIRESTEVTMTTKGMMTSEKVQSTTEDINDVTNYTDFITQPPSSSPSNETAAGNAAQTKPFNFFTMLTEHAVMLAVVGTILILLVPIILIVIVKKACKRKKNSHKIQIERSMDYEIQMGSETTGFTYEPHAAPRPRYQSFRKGFKRFSKRPWSDREEDSSDEEL